MIPKILHYCWFGTGDYSKTAENCMRTWKELCPDYEIRFWNEDNVGLSESCDYVREAYAQGQWAFVSDYVRLYVLSRFGGIYLDTDVELLRPFDDLLEDGAFLCAESRYSVCTAVIGAQAGHPLLQRLLNEYERMSFLTQKGKADLTPNSHRLYTILSKEYGYQYQPEHTSRLAIGHDTAEDAPAGLTIYPESWFSPINCYTGETNICSNTYAIHHYEGTWKGPAARLKDRALALATRIMGERTRYKLKKWLRGKEGHGK